MKSLKPISSNGKVVFRSKGAFWIGFISVSVGVALQLPMYIHSENMGYRLVGMPMTASMNWGMVLEVLGLLITLYSLLPSKIQEQNDYQLKIKSAG